MREYFEEIDEEGVGYIDARALAKAVHAAGAEGISLPEATKLILALNEDSMRKGSEVLFFDRFVLLMTDGVIDHNGDDDKKRLQRSKWTSHEKQVELQRILDKKKEDARVEAALIQSLALAWGFGKDRGTLAEELAGEDRYMAMYFRLAQKAQDMEASAMFVNAMTFTIFVAV
jgi:hypothetical protein